MKNYLFSLEKNILTLLKKVSKVADKRNVKAYLIGGIVRDLLLGRQNKDIDIVIDGDLRDFSDDVASQLKAKVTFYPRFHTASMKGPGGICLDVASFRAEKYAYAGALPEVRKGTFLEDVTRRDFTINALALSLNGKTFGRLIDYCGGYKDLMKKKIRIFHEESFLDDPTRIFRAVRFEQRFNFTMERKTLRALKEALKNIQKTQVAPARYFAEFKKILCEENPLKPLKRINDLGALALVHSHLHLNLYAVRKLYRNIQAVKKKPLFDISDTLWLPFFMALLQNLQEQQRLEVVTSLPLRSEEKKTILQLMHFSDIIDPLDQMNLKPSEIYQELCLLTDDALFFIYAFTSRKKVLRNIENYLRYYRLVSLKITGHDLKKLGLTQGRQMGEVLTKVLYRKMDKGFKRKQEEIAEAQKIIGGRKENEPSRKS